MDQKTIIAALLSTFIYPGAGQIYQKRKKMGYTIAITVTIVILLCVILFEWDLIRQMQSLQHLINNPEKYLHQTWTQRKDFYLGSFLTIGLLWLTSILLCFKKP